MSRKLKFRQSHSTRETWPEDKHTAFGQQKRLSTSQTVSAESSHNVNNAIEAGHMNGRPLGKKLYNRYNMPKPTRLLKATRDRRGKNHG